MQQLAIFLDDAGTMNDAVLRDQQVANAAGEYLSGRCGGSPERWALAHTTALAELWEEYRQTMFGNVDADYSEFRHKWLTTWITRMCELTGTPHPSQAECLDLAVATERYATRQVRAAFPGAIDAIQTLYDRGYTLHTASSEDSAELQGYLEGMGIRHCFCRLYGPDLVNTIKEGPVYYTRVFADAGVEPGRALVVDDNPLVIGWAAEAGAWTARIGSYDGDWPEPHLQLDSLSELPDAVRRLEETLRHPSDGDASTLR